jgi:Lar family restriction alleviation protein
MDELKRCPFCGGEAEIEEVPGSPYTNESYAWACGCKKCNIGWYKESKPEAIAAWNRRASNWVSVEEKKPIQDDANKWGQVFVMYENGLISEYPYHLIKQNSGITHWMPLPQPPKEVK